MRGPLVLVRTMEDLDVHVELVCFVLLVLAHDELVGDCKEQARQGQRGTPGLPLRSREDEQRGDVPRVMT